MANERPRASPPSASGRGSRRSAPSGGTSSCPTACTTPWKRKLFVALCRRYGLKLYRERGQRKSTVLVLAPRTLHNKTFWPEYLALAEELDMHLAYLTERVIREAIHDDTSDAQEDEPKGLPEPAP